MAKKKLVVLTGAGMSAESGLSTFRDSGGLWEQHDVAEVASIEGWRKNPQLVQNFYNERRAELKTHEPNKGHFILKELEQFFNVFIITQNVDNFHERAGSSYVLHLHGELTKIKSEKNDALVYETTEDVRMGDVAEDGAQLRPDVVWFGEAVPNMAEAIDISRMADIFLVIGSSLQVYPAASLVDFVPPDAEIFIIDPKPVNAARNNTHFIRETASEGLQYFLKLKAQ